jgi:DNA-binding transcriptional regulator WhiA
MVETFKRKKIDNFAKRARNKQIEKGWIKVNYPPFIKSGDLAELIGVVLGDGNIGKFPRTECLTISCNSNNKGFIDHYAGLVEKLFGKKSYIAKVNKEKECAHIRIYQKYISKRLGIPTGNRSKIEISIPKWILQNKGFLKRYLRGLYEAEGSFCVHKPTYTYKFLFSNRNESLLENVYRALKILGFYPHKSQYKIQISRKEEVYKIKNLIKFRKY